MPVVVGGAFVGIAGADLLLSWLERASLSVMRTIDAPAALVNHERRVVMTTLPCSRPVSGSMWPAWSTRTATPSLKILAGNWWCCRRSRFGVSCGRRPCGGCRKTGASDLSRAVVDQTGR